MVQGWTMSTLTTAGGSGVYGSTPLWSRHFKIMEKTQITSGIERPRLWHRCVDRLFFIGHPDKSRHRSLRVGAGWLFKGGDQGLEARSEHSVSANEDILIFFFQLDLATRVQYALNMEQYEIAQQLRNKLTEVEAEVIRQQETKRGSTSKTEAQDKAISILRLRADLQNAIENESYALAAKLRDEISKLEAESLSASAKALAYENAQYAFRLGQKVLVDVHADPNLLVAYVAEENLLAPEKPDMGRFDHPYASFLFYGMDAAGDFIPIKQLREKFNRPRYEVPTDSEDEGTGEDA
ncbi:clp protease adapter protein ClpF, chloroplastic isoform X2 [Malania oleifera]|uniref:clp protease adapter protein ClpF, chloroplastic isoform X2 n=1 Tax=Malania oleifera TaxID=397392 RepID=UPI0025AE45A3|nr:clp protease adapter protein ClpF, chloroplastic isoform X2 [Malania oleifera]XP_057947982.1 clp protease adapter protein ClpF, chloroplastic isoform X2 [Malania oleifera]